VEEFNYTTLSIVFLTCSNGRGYARIGFSLLDREIRVSFDLEYLGRRSSFCGKISWKNLLSSFTLAWFPRQLQFAIPLLGGQKAKTFPQISRKRVGRSSSFWCSL